MFQRYRDGGKTIERYVGKAAGMLNPKPKVKTVLSLVKENGTTSKTTNVSVSLPTDVVVHIDHLAMMKALSQSTVIQLMLQGDMPCLNLQIIQRPICESPGSKGSSADGQPHKKYT